MNWIADASAAGVALWAALILTGLVAGSLIARWNSPIESRRDEQLLVVTAAAVVIAWCANAGSLIGSASSNQLFHAYIPIPVAAGYRLTPLWATLPGAALTIATFLLVRASLGGLPRAAQRTRLLAAIATIALVALGIAVWFTPAPNVLASRIPPFVQSAPAAAAPLFALGAIIVLAVGVAIKIAGAPPSRSLIWVAWILATLAVAAEQLARSTLGVGPRDAIVLGSASSGLMLWLLASALLHRRVQSLLFSVNSPERGRVPARVAHAGAILLAVSFGVHGSAKRQNISLAPGASASVTDAFKGTWQLANQGVSRFDTADDADVLSLALDVRSPSGKTDLLTPEIREHHGPHGEHLENSVSRRASTGAVIQTMRVLLVGADSLDVASIRITFLPLPILWPAGLALLLVAVLISKLGDRPSHE